VQLEARDGRLIRRWPMARDGGWNLEVTRAGPSVVIAHLEGGAVTILDPASGQEHAIATAEGEIDAAPTIDGREIWSVNVRNGTLSVIDVAAGRVVHTDRVSSSLSRVAMTPDGRTALVVSIGDSSLVAFDVRTRARRAAVTIAGDPKVIALSPDGRRAYVTHPQRGRVTLVDVAAMAVLGTAALDGTPDGVAVMERRR
jgi:DNA-binding beta-propeller fold protein YncE